ncbi:MAG: hypothetical protein V5A46_06295, partial [Haloferacaceae archaeon]
MSHAYDALQDALEATEALLFPISLRRWLALAVAAFFVGGSTGFDVNYNVGVGAVDVPVRVSGPGTPVGTLFPGTAIPQFLIFFGGALAVGAVLWYFGALFEFVFVEQLRTRDAKLSDRLGPAIRPGLSLFGFRLLVGLLVTATALFAALLPAAFGVAGVALVLAFLPGLFVVGSGLWLANRLTTDFVVPVMIATGDGFVDAWRAFWTELRKERREYGLYLLVRILLGLLASVVLAVGYLATALVVGLPLGILFLATFHTVAVFVSVSLAQTVAVLSLLAGATIVVVAGTVLVAVPVRTYLRYYALFVLGGASPAYDLVGEIREEMD